MNGSRVWVPGIVAIIARFLPANEVACTLRLVDKASSQQFAKNKIVRLSLPSPTHVFQRHWGRPGAFRGLTRKQRWKLLCLTAASGSTANLEVALDAAGLLVTGELLEAAVEAAQLDTCRLLRELGCPWGDSLAAAARGGHRHMCEWLLASGCPFYCFAVCGAARCGHEGLMHWWLLQLAGQGSDTADHVSTLLPSAAEGLSLQALQELHQQLLAAQQQQQGGAVHEPGGEVQPPRGLSHNQQSSTLAAAAGSLTPDWQAKVEWLEGLGYPRTLEACFSAASSGSPEATAIGRLQWLHSRGYPLGEGVANMAASCGDVVALQFLMERQDVWPTTILDYVAMHGHLAVLQYLHTRGLPMEDHPDIPRLAARGAHLPVVAWVVETLGVNPNNTSDLLNWAARSGSIELLAWLRERGWSWSQGVIAVAAKCGCEEALEWLVAQGCPWPADGRPYVEAARHGDLATIRCLHRLGCPWGPRPLTDCIRRDVRGGSPVPVPVPVLRALVELGCPVDWDAVAAAAETRGPAYHTAVLEWLGSVDRQQQRQ